MDRGVFQPPELRFLIIRTTVPLYTRPLWYKKGVRKPEMAR